MNNHKHIWFAVDENGDECVFVYKPIRDTFSKQWYNEDYGDPEEQCCFLPKGTIRRITGKKITWKDKPIKWKP